MNLDELKRLMVYVAGEKGKSISLSPEQFAEGAHLAQLKHFKRKLGMPESYQPGMPIPAQAFEITERITEDMRHFKALVGWEHTEPMRVNPKGMADYPAKYYIVTSVTYFTELTGKKWERKIDVLSDLEFEDATTSVAKEPDELFPVCNLQSSHIRFRPTNLKRVNMAYLRLPIKPYYATTNHRGFLEFDEAHSRNLEWDEMNQMDIVAIMLSDLGVRSDNQELYQYAEKIKERGI